MARKSSKTAHVMNLLAGGEAETSKSEAAKENLAASQAAESKGTIKELTVLAQQASIQMQEGPLSPSPISIIDLSSSVPDPVAELIRQQLEEAEKEEPPTEESDELTDPEEIPETEPLVEPMPQSDVLDTDEIPQSDMLDTEQNIQPDIHNSQEPTAAPAPDFKYLNVMEYVVENIAKDHMERLGGCTCRRCIADVIALTLTKLPPKYVVVEPPAASPLLNFYSSRFAPQVMVELTKSCFTVKENPHH